MAGLANSWARVGTGAMDFLEGPLHEGSPFTGVVKVAELGGSGSFAGTLQLTGQAVCVFLDPATCLEGFAKVTLINFAVLSREGKFKLFQVEGSRVFFHEPYNASNLLKIKETCSGVGALGRGGDTIGFRVVALNEVQPITAQVAAGLASVPVVVGDINDLSIVVQLWDAAPGDGVFASGFSCQPYSKLGDRRGGSDPRSSALTGSLRAAYLHQSSAILLECVQPAAEDPFVQGSLRAFQTATGFFCSQTVLELHKVWGARRTRWWALLTSPDVGPVPVESWRPHGPWHAVEDIIDSFNATASEMEQLTLQPSEVAIFEDLRPMSSFCVVRNQPLPTALHSWGAALTACPCQCRASPFTWDRLKRDGLLSVVVPLCETGPGTGFRYPTAQEVALLNGLSPSLSYGPDARLGLTLIGQMASPLQSAWLLGALARKLVTQDAVFSGTVDGIQILHTQRRVLLRQAEEEGYRPFTGGHLLSECPSICFDTRANILRKSVSCFSSSLPPHKKARLSPGDGHRTLPSAPQGPTSGQVLCQALQGGRPSDIKVEQGIAAEVAAALLPALASGAIHPAALPSAPGGRDNLQRGCETGHPSPSLRLLGFSPRNGPVVGYEVAGSVNDPSHTAATAALATAPLNDTVPASFPPPVSPLGVLGFRPEPVLQTRPGVGDPSPASGCNEAPDVIDTLPRAPPLGPLGVLGFRPALGAPEMGGDPGSQSSPSCFGPSWPLGRLDVLQGARHAPFSGQICPMGPDLPIGQGIARGMHNVGLFTGSEQGCRALQYSHPTSTVIEVSDSEGDPIPAAAAGAEVSPMLLSDRGRDTDISPPTALVEGSWNELSVSSPVCLMQFLRTFTGVRSFLATSDGRTFLQVTSALQAGQRLWLWVPSLGPSGRMGRINPEGMLLEGGRAQEPLVLPSAARAEILSLQRSFLADDQVAFSLGQVAGALPNTVVVDPILLMQCVQDEDPEPLRPLDPAFNRQTTVISAVPLKGHWVSFAWDLRHLRFRAWDSCLVGHLDVEIASVHRIWGKVLGLGASSFSFCQAPPRPPVPGLCGHFALADLWCRLRGHDYPSDDGALALAATFAAAFELDLRSDKLVRVPRFYGGGAGDLVSLGLASLLREKGVPANRASERASQAVDRLGASSIQEAMTAKVPWRALKQLGNNCTPAFQFVLEDELQKSIRARAEGPDPNCRKKRDSRTKPEVNPSQVPRLPKVEELVVPEGVFASEGRPLCQVDFQSLGANSVGVALVTPLQAEPYLRLGQPVSQGALALVVIGDVDCGNATVQVQKVRFRAKLVATGEPLLVSGTLAQIGNQWVDKHVPRTTPVDVAESCIARIAVHRDSCPIPWDRFIASPLKEVVSIVPVLQTCDIAGCECQKWHGTSDPGQPPSILETWGRCFYNVALKPVPPSAATSFQVFIRLPAQLEMPLQAYSGMSGVYVEPREDGVKLPSARFAVIWLPKGSQREALLLMQTHPSIVGLARIGERFGVRCLKSDEEALHNKLRPTTTWVDKSRLRVYESGPWPFGTQRQVISRALVSFGWQKARPAQPCPGRRGGLWFLIEAATSPPSDSLHASFGEVIFHEVTSAAPIAHDLPPVLASRRTLQGMCPVDRAMDRKGTDPLQVTDPWQVALDRSSSQRAPSGCSAFPGDAARQIEQSVLQKIKASTTESSGSSSIEAAIMAKVESRLAESHGELDARINSLDSKVGQVAQKVDSQEGLLQSLFAEQMCRIEELIGSTKKPRAE